MSLSLPLISNFVQQGDLIRFNKITNIKSDLTNLMESVRENKEPCAHGHFYSKPTKQKHK